MKEGHMKESIWIVGSVFFISVAIAGAVVAAERRWPASETPCERFGDVPIRSVPARCARHFGVQ